MKSWGVGSLELNPLRQAYVCEKGTYRDVNGLQATVGTSEPAVELGVSNAGVTELYLDDPIRDLDPNFRTSH